ncbi:MAG: DUF2157 domain-containing protein [Flavobacteriaceae bacterium]|nr:DUF2157 domain-containing protein [Flavobacteriaceae bacterium]
MGKQNEILTKKLVSKGFISSEQHIEIKKYWQLAIFSLNSELLFFLYISVLLFTSGVGIVLYKNIDTIGHKLILAVNVILILVCFYFSFKKAKGFSRKEVVFDNPVYDYLVLAGSILSCIFVGYIQYQFSIFGKDFGLASLFSAAFCFVIAYYFDNKSVLSIAITALATFIGITITPKTLLANEVYSNPQLSYYGLALGAVLILIMEYTIRVKAKEHFHIVYATFAFNLIGICAIAGLLENYWYIFILLLALAIFYFYKVSHQIVSTFMFVFTLLYAYVGINIFLGRLIRLLDTSSIIELIIYLLPFYFIGSIFLFIKLIQKFNKEKHAGIQ